MHLFIEGPRRQQAISDTTEMNGIYATGAIQRKIGTVTEKLYINVPLGAEETVE